MNLTWARSTSISRAVAFTFVHFAQWRRLMYRFLITLFHSLFLSVHIPPNLSCNICSHNLAALAGASPGLHLGFTWASPKACTALPTKSVLLILSFSRILLLLYCAPVTISRTNSQVRQCPSLRPPTLRCNPPWLLEYPTIFGLSP